jgi:hypothetical protein
VGSLFAYYGGLRFGLSHVFGFSLFCGMTMALLSGLVAALRYEEKPAPQGNRAAVMPRSLCKWKRIHHLVDGLVIGVCAGLGFGVMDALLVEPGQMSVYLYGTVVGFLFTVVFATGMGTHAIEGLGVEIKPAEIVAWSWKHAWSHFPANLRNGLLGGLAIAVIMLIIFGTASSLFYGVAYGMTFGSIYALICGLVVAIAIILAGLLNSGWSSMILDEHLLVRVNEGIQRSARNSLLAACLSGPVGGIASGLASGVAFGLLGHLSGWLILGIGFTLVVSISFALVFGCMRGGIACVEHYVLRLFLWRAKCIPWKYAKFLDYAAERIVLRKVGAGYIFAHRLLLDYFAGL